MILYFGQVSSYYFYPLKANENSSLQAVSTPGNIYLFDGLPTLENARTGTSVDGATVLGSAITSWANTPDGFGKIITIPRQADPDPDSEIHTHTYYLAINTPVETGDVSAHAPIIKDIQFTRLRAQEGKLLVTNGDLYAVAPEMRKFVCSEGVEPHINSAITEVRQRFNNFDTSFADIKNPALLNTAVKYLAISNFMFGQSRGQGSMEFASYLHYKEKYQEQLKIIELEIQKQGTTETGKIAGGNKGYFSTMRVTR